ncbi:MAG: ABC transporter permease [Phaeodactylibacter sp.]|nr:ABC transporter permease [Phaeodactylibacter sp.]MCB9296536.1 ABC transporter permease [Lewinellaceae bacterium]
MTVGRIGVSVSMMLRMMFRRRIIPILLLVIPTVFLLAVYATTSERMMPFRLASVDEAVFLEASERNISLLFLAVASVGFLSSFLALNLIQRESAVDRRLVLCGFHPVALLLSKLAVLAGCTALIALYVGLSLLAFFTPERLFLMILGLFLAGLAYGSYGLLVGSLIRGELEGVLLIVLLANIDAGWLQNPLFYAEAENQFIIRCLPAYFPSQAAIAAAFSDHPIGTSVLASGLYALAFLAIAGTLYFIKMRRK